MDISSLRDRNDTAMTVSELNAFIKSIFDSNRLLSSVSVRGEISNFINHRSGHLYFSIKDEEGQLRAVMFKSYAMRLKFIPENGMKVTLHGSVTVYPRDGSYQMYVTSMQPDGIGGLYLAYEQLKEKLASEGLFDESNKKSIPQFPEKIGIVTSPTGAAVRDVINVISRRYPLADIYLYPALVQGDGAEATLIDGIDYFDRSGLVDTIIIGRGGGSIEDLWAFNSEPLARRIHACTVPVISAVGHETDFTICDFVADMRAPTPSAAAELSVPDIRDIMITVDNLADRADRALVSDVTRRKERLEAILSRPVISSPEEIVSPLYDRVNSLAKDLGIAYSRSLDIKKSKLGICLGKLEALNPISVLARGYAAVESQKRVIASVNNVKPGDDILIHMVDGTINAVAKKITGTSKEVQK